MRKIAEVIFLKWRMIIINKLKKIAIGIRGVIKLAVIFIVAILLILGILQITYKQTYSVSLNGEIIGYTNDKVTLQKKINNYITSGNGQDVAFVDIENLPTYTVCLLKKNIQTNDDEILEKVTSSGTSYYKYYAITADNNEKSYVSTFSDAQSVVDTLKDKDSANSDSLGIVEKYSNAKPIKDGEEESSTSNSENNSNNENDSKEASDSNENSASETNSNENAESDNNSNETENKEATASKAVKLSSVDESVDAIYEKKVTVVETSSYKKIATTIDNSQTSVKTDIGITLIRPVSGTISSRFGSRSRDNHKGLDIAAPKGTAIKAAASGTVLVAGYNSSYSGYGNCVVVRCSSSVIIIYGQCSQVYVQAGETVAQGQVISAVGSTGISTGNHLHFEIRYNGTAIDPQNYVYN